MQQKKNKKTNAGGRYERHLTLPEIGSAGQKRLGVARVLVVGAGGLGSPVALYLAAAGIGTLGIVDDDVVEESNLQRQILYVTRDVGRMKVAAAVERLRELNSDVRLIAIPRRLTAESGPDMVKDYDVVIDATDTYESKFRVAAACHAAGRPVIHGGIREFEGHVLTVLPGKSACYRCVFDRIPSGEPVRPRGPLGAVPGVLGALQAAEAIKYLLSIGELLSNRLLFADIRAGVFRTVAMRRNPACRLCGERSPGRSRAGQTRGRKPS